MFKDAYDKLIGAEGGYANLSGDTGGETYKGIARHYNPNWDGWVIIDDYKKSNGDHFKEYLNADRQLQVLAQDFYKKNYWDRFKGDSLPGSVGSELLEQSVNLGTWKTAGTNLQRALNLLNRNGRLFSDLTVDGLVGNNTLKAVDLVSPSRLVRVLNGLQFMRYYDLVMHNPANEKFVGWFDRI